MFGATNWAKVIESETVKVQAINFEHGLYTLEVSHICTSERHLQFNPLDPAIPGISAKILGGEIFTQFFQWETPGVKNLENLICIEHCKKCKECTIFFQKQFNELDNLYIEDYLKLTAKYLKARYAKDTGNSKVSSQTTISTLPALPTGDGGAG